MRVSLLVPLLMPLTVWAVPYPSTQSPEQAAYTSPYGFKPIIKTSPAIADFTEGARDFSNWQNWSLTEYENWYNFDVIEGLNSTWGPYFKPFRAPEGIDHHSLETLQIRIVAAASTLRNTVPYGHHHMQVWDVPDTSQ